MNNPFPTRQYPYRREGPSRAGVMSKQAQPELAPGKLYRWILGLDDAAGSSATGVPRAMSDSEVAGLADPFARLLGAISPSPVTAHSLVAALDNTGLTHESFVVGEGLQIPWSDKTSSLARQLRIAVAWKKAGKLAVLLSTAPPFDDQGIFLQVVGWDDQANHLNFYERRLGAWIYAGNSTNALTEPTRGKGPFDSHVNGALVMKELKAPWLHWSSMAAFDLPGVQPTDSLRQEPLFREREGAEKLEQLVRSSVRQWTVQRLNLAIQGGTLSDAPALLRHVLTPTTLNLVASPQESETIPTDGRLGLPMTPFLDSGSLFDLVAIPIDPPPLSTQWPFYRRMLVDQGYELRDENGHLAHEGDTHFAFPAFERSLEDQQVVSLMLQRGLLSKRMAACLVMVDFPNPVWSERREALMRHVPASASHSAQGWNLEAAMLQAIQNAVVSPASPEAEFLELWSVGDDWPTQFGQRITNYLQALQTRLDSWDGFEAIGRLIESQRRRARKRPLLEFSLTLPRAVKLPDACLRMTFHATVEETN